MSPRASPASRGLPAPPPPRRGPPGRGKAWYRLHKWSSLACTLFLLVVCASGLPLIFDEEIVAWLDPSPPWPTLAPGTVAPSLDALIHAARQSHERHRIVDVELSRDPPRITLGLAPGPQASPGTPALRLEFDARDGAPRAAISEANEGWGTRIVTLMTRLHIDLYGGLPGQLLLGTMALLFTVSVVSGVVLYHPYMKKLPFGTVRVHRSRRLKWLDLHNLLGVVTVVWALMMGLTGAIHELAVPLFRHWLSTDVQAVVAPAGQAPASGAWPVASVQQAYATARAAVPGRQVESLRFPDAGLGLPRHYLLWARGDTALGAHLFDAVLVDATTGRLAAVLDMPWYLRVLQFSRPLHYGDTAGPPLKLIWAALDLILMVILGSGLYLWRRRGKT